MESFLNSEETNLQTASSLPPPPMINQNNAVVSNEGDALLSFKESERTPNHPQIAGNPTRTPTDRAKPASKELNKRARASRQNSQKSGPKKINVVPKQLEAELKSLQEEVLIIPPKIEHIERRNCLLETEIASIRDKISLYLEELSSKRAKYEGLKKERDVLKQIYDEVSWQRQLESMARNMENRPLIGNESGSNQFDNHIYNLMDPEIPFPFNNHNIF